MPKSVKVFSVLLLVCALLMVSGCQTSYEATETLALETEAPQQTPASSPTPDPAETPTPEPTPEPTTIPTADPLNIRFGSSGNEMFNGGGPVYSVAWAPDSSQLAMGGNTKIVIWETRRLTRVGILEGHTAPIEYRRG